MAIADRIADSRPSRYGVGQAEDESARTNSWRKTISDKLFRFLGGLGLSARPSALSHAPYRVKLPAVIWVDRLASSRRAI